MFQVENNLMELNLGIPSEDETLLPQEMSSRGVDLSVSDFYSKRSILITGVTGFLGKALIEKLQFSFEDIDKVYVLIRKSRGLTAQQRFENILESGVFERLKKQKPHLMSKIILVEGDLLEQNLGISSEDKRTLLQEDLIVFHAAAMIKLDAPLREIYQMNVEGTRKVLALSRQITGLKAFVYFSSAYSSCTRSEVEEVVYPAPATCEAVNSFLNQYEKEDYNEAELKTLLAGHPYTYTFTKALAEELVARRSGSMPVAILRPSIVLPSVTEPAEGWVDCMQGAMILFHAAAKGHIRVMPGDKTVVARVIPVDYVVNMAIVAATTCACEKLAVYNCCTGEVNPITWKEAAKLYIDEAVRKGFSPRARTVYWTQNPTKAKIVSFFYESAPAHLMDLGLCIRGNERSYSKQLQKVSLLKSAAQFIMKDWKVRTPRARELAESLGAADRLRFPCHPAGVVWPAYLAACFRGMLRHEEEKAKKLNKQD